MIRAIDATELKTAFPLGEYVRTECVQATIDHMPTVEAIPIEWLISRCVRAYDDNDTAMCDCIGVLVDEWQEEQEAE